MSDRKTRVYDRRTFVKLGSAGVVGGLAGCTGGGGGGSDDGGGGGDGSDGGGGNGDGGGDGGGGDGAPVDSLTLAGGGEGGAWYLGAATWAEFAKESYPSINTTATTGGGQSNAVKVGNGDLQIAWNFTSTTNVAYAGGGDFPQAFEDIRHVASVWPAHVLALANPDIQSYADLEGKAIAPGKVGFSGYAAALMLLDYYEIGEDSVDVVSGGYSEMPTFFQDNQVASVHVMGSVPHPVIDNSLAQRDGRLLPVSDEVGSRIVEENPGWIQLPIPAGSFDAVNNADSDVPTVGAQTHVIAHKDVPEDLIYELVKRNFSDEGMERMSNAHSVYGKMALDAVASGKGDIPFHAGAERALEELGADI
jgi:TRAP transporter TAXI family solute receptor